MTNSAKHNSIAFFFRYSPADDVDLSPGMPMLLAKLSERATIDYFSLASRRPVPLPFKRFARLHTLPARIDRSSSANKLLCALGWYAALPWMLLRCRWMGIDVVCINDYCPGAAALAHVFYGGEVISWVADFLHEEYARTRPLLTPLARLLSALDRWAWRRNAAIITLAASTRDYLSRIGVPADRITVSHDPCDFATYHPLLPAERDEARKQFGYAPEEVVLVHHGVLHPNKSLAELLPGFRDALDQQPQLRLLLVGNGPERKHLEQLCDRLELSGTVQFTGWLPGIEDVNRALGAGDIGLVSRSGSFSDHFHTTSALVHCMAAGLPILASRLDGIAAVVDDARNGLLFQPQDGASFSSRLLELAENQLMREEMGTRSLKDARERFDADALAETLAKVIGDLV